MELTSIDRLFEKVSICTVVPTAKKKLNACIHGSTFNPCNLRMQTLPPVSRAPTDKPCSTHSTMMKINWMFKYEIMK